ncbi:MAG: hypothetical protein EU541_08390 [Promethearchaeota archaeon]|nr:MAG: hypothetical protein EU541_08390 [Candidatus Lokiarchaeota archaeon]
MELIYDLLYDLRLPLKTSLDISLIPIFYSYIATISLQISLTMFWLAYNALITYNNLKNYNIEPWIKKRYLFIAISALFLGLSSFANFFFPLEGGYEAVHPILFIFVASALIIFSFGNLFAWIMPNFLKGFFNREYEPKNEDILSERELLDKIKKQVLGGRDNGNH